MQPQSADYPTQEADASSYKRLPYETNQTLGGHPLFQKKPPGCKRGWYSGDPLFNGPPNLPSLGAAQQKDAQLYYYYYGSEGELEEEGGAGK